MMSSDRFVYTEIGVGGHGLLSPAQSRDRSVAGSQSVYRKIVALVAYQQWHSPEGLGTEQTLPSLLSILG